MSVVLVLGRDDRWHWRRSYSVPPTTVLTDCGITLHGGSRLRYVNEVPEPERCSDCREAIGRSAAALAQALTARLATEWLERGVTIAPRAVVDAAVELASFFELDDAGVRHLDSSDETYGRALDRFVRAVKKAQADDDAGPQPGSPSD